MLGGIFTYQLVNEYLIFGFNLKLLGAMLLSLLLISIPSFFAWIMIDKYKKELHLFNSCTQSSSGIVKKVELSKHNIGHSNPTFITIEFKGNKKDFLNIPDSWRFKFKPNDTIPVLYNPLNPSEFVIGQV